MKYGILLALALTLLPIDTYAANRGGGGGGSRGGGGGAPRGLNSAPRGDYRGSDRGHSSYSFGFSYNSGGWGIGGSYSSGRSTHYYRGSVYYNYAPVYYTPRPIYVEPAPIVVAPPVYYEPVYSPVYVPATTYYYYGYPSISVGAYYYRR